MVREADFNHNNPLFGVAILLVLGILVGDACSCSLSTISVCISLVFIVVFATMSKPVISTLCVNLLMFTLGVWLVSFQKDSRIKVPQGERLYKAVVTNRPQIKGKVYQCDLLIIGQGAPFKVKASLLRQSQEDAELLATGDGVVFASEMQPVDSVKQFRSNFDYRRWLRVNGYEAQTFVWKNWARRRLDIRHLSDWTKAKLVVSIWRDKLIKQYQQLGFEDRKLALISAMTLGDKTYIDKQQREDYSISGASHILALSGLHLAIIYAILKMFLGILGKFFMGITDFSVRGIVRFLMTMISLAAIWTYVVIVGMSPSVTRAATMISLYAIVDLLNRSHHSFNTIAFAAIVMLIINPLSLWDVSFQLSFAAVLGILLFQPARRYNAIIGMAWVSISAQIAVAPLVMYYFGRFSCYFLLTNCIVIPCATLILYGSLFMWLFSSFYLLRHWLMWGVENVVTIMDNGVRWIASLPGASIDNIQIDTFDVCAFYVMIFCAYQIISITLCSK